MPDTLIDKIAAATVYEVKPGREAGWCVMSNRKVISEHPHQSEAAAEAERLNARAALDAVLGALEEPSEAMVRAWIIACGFEGDPDRKIVAHGTGQGDLRMVPEWADIAEMLNVWTRYKAMIAQFRKDNQDG